MNHPLLEPTEIQKLAAEILEEVVAKERRILGTRLVNRDAKRWWEGSDFQGEIQDETAEKIAAWLEFRLARS